MTTRRRRADWSLGAMERNTRRLQSLVDDLLTLAKVSYPSCPLVSGQVDLARLAQDAMDMFLPGRRPARHPG